MSSSTTRFFLRSLVAVVVLACLVAAFMFALDVPKTSPISVAENESAMGVNGVGSHLAHTDRDSTGNEDDPNEVERESKDEQLERDDSERRGEEDSSRPLATENGVPRDFDENDSTEHTREPVEEGRAVDEDSLEGIDWSAFYQSREHTSEFQALVDAAWNDELDIRMIEDNRARLDARLASGDRRAGQRLAVGMGLVDRLISILTTPDLRTEEYRLALRLLTSQNGNRGAKAVLPFLGHSDPELEADAWRFFAQNHVPHLAEEIAENLPEIEPPEVLRVARREILEAVRRHPTPASVRWLQDTGKAEGRGVYVRNRGRSPDSQEPHQFSQDIAEVFTWVTGIEIESLSPPDGCWREMNDGLGGTDLPSDISWETRTRNRGVFFDSQRRLRAPVATPARRTRLAELEEELLTHGGALQRVQGLSPRQAFEERLIAEGLAAAGPCLRTLRQVSLAARAEQTSGAVVYHADVRFLCELENTMLAGQLEAFALRILDAKMWTERSWSRTQVSDALQSILEYFVRIGSSGLPRDPEGSPVGFALIERCLELSTETRLMRETNIVGLAYEAAQSLDDPALIPAVLAARESQSSGRSRFGYTMSSLTRHTFGNKEANNDPANWRRWLAANARN